MKRMISILLFVGLWMAGCQGSGLVNQSTDVPCAGAHNDGEVPYCHDYIAKNYSFISTAYAYEITIELGDISRGTMIIGEGIVDNPLPTDFYGYASFIIVDGGCNGATEWRLMEMQPITVQAGQIKDVVGTGGQCGDMSLGQHTAIATVYADDGITKIGEVTIHFNLVN